MFDAHPASKLAHVKQACIAITQTKNIYVAAAKAQVLMHLSMLSPTGVGGVAQWVGILTLSLKNSNSPPPRQNNWSKSPPGAREGGQMSFKP